MRKAVILLIKVIESGLTKEFLVNDLCASVGAFCSHLYIKKNNEAQVLCFSFFFKGPKLSSGGKTRAVQSQQKAINKMKDLITFPEESPTQPPLGTARGKQLHPAEEGTSWIRARKP